MKENLQAALDLIILWEGKDINRSVTEPGGISKYGISLTAYADYCKANKLDPPTEDTIANLTETDARNWYATWWLPQIHFDTLPPGIDVRLADIATNLGVVGSIKLLQECLNASTITGKLNGETTLALQASTSAPDRAAALCAQLGTAWLLVKHKSLNWYKYKAGWTHREIFVTAACLTLITNTIDVANTIQGNTV